MASGPLVRLEGGVRASRGPSSPAVEHEAIGLALASAQEALALLCDQSDDEQAASILAFQLALLEDDEIVRPTHEGIDNAHPADLAWQRVIDALIEDYRRSQEPYFRERAADLCDLRDRVLDVLHGGIEQAIPAGAIVLAEDFAPSRFLTVDWKGGGLVLRNGGTTGHVAILARSRGVPMLVGVDLKGVVASGEALLDAHGCWCSNRMRPSGRNSTVAAAYAGRRVPTVGSCRLKPERPTEKGACDDQRCTSEARRYGPQHVDGIGLVRTVSLPGRERLPGEEEQYRVCRRIAEWANGRPVTIRTLDAGGDKPIPSDSRA
jgi:phosphotransferase system enzyme I (PtsI)